MKNFSILTIQTYKDVYNGIHTKRKELEMFMLLTKTDHQQENDMPWFVWAEGTKKKCVEQMEKWMELEGSKEAKVIKVKNRFCNFEDAVLVDYMCKHNGKIIH